MWSTSLFIFSLLGIGSTHNIFYRTGGSDISNGFVSSQDPKEMVQKFLARITRSIESKDVSIISGLFQPGFVFKGCRGTYDKQKIVQILSNIPSGTKLSMTLKSAEDQGSSIKYTVSATGFDKSEITAEFVLNKIDQQLESGSIPKCPAVGHSFSSEYRISDTNSDADVKQFFGQIIKSISSKNPIDIAAHFQPKFIFKGCKGEYTKEKVVEMLTNLPSEYQLSINLKSSEYVDEDEIKYTACIRGIGAPVYADFFLNRTNPQLIGGSVISCPHTRKMYYDDHEGVHNFIGRSAEVNPEEMAKKFIDRVDRSIESKDVSIISGPFQPGFVFKGCKGLYDKEKVVGLLSNLPSGIKFSMNLKSAVDNGVSIIYEVSVSGFSTSEINARFVLNKRDQQLEFGRVLVCSSSFSSIFQRASSDANSDVEIQKFLDRMSRSVSSKDSAVIAGLLQPNFFFKGCKGDYTKEKAVQILSNLPADSKFSVSLKSSEYVGGETIKYSVDVNGFGSPVVAEFFFSRSDQQLIGGSVPACAKSRQLRSTQNANEVVKSYLSDFDAAVRTRDEKKITAFFQPNFILKGCNGKYNVEKLVGILSSLSSDKNFRTKFIDATQVNSSFIRFDAVISGLGRFDLAATYLLNQDQMAVETGKRYDCADFPALQKKRSIPDVEPTPIEDIHAIVDKFVTKFEKFVKTKDDFIIGELFQPNFTFGACTETYDKDDAIQIMLALPFGGNFTCRVVSVEDGGGFINVLVSMDGMGQQNVEIRMIMNKNVERLESAHFENCPKIQTPEEPQSFA